MSKKYNICHFSDVLFVGGLETYIASLLNALVDDGHNAFLVGQRISKEMYDLLDNRVIIMESLINYSLYSKFIINNKIDVLHAHPVDMIPTCFELSKKHNIPMTITYHGQYGWCHNLHGQFPIVAVSKEVQNILNKDIRLSNRIHYIQNGIDTLQFYPQNKKNDSEKFKILFIGRVDIDKKYSINKIVQATRNMRNIELIVAGMGAEFDNVKKSVPMYVKMLGYRTDMNEIINEADIVIATGRGIRESMLCKKPCISMDACYYDGIVSEETISDIEYSNFSGRSKIRVPMTQEVITNDIQKLKDEKFRSDLSEWSYKYAVENYTLDIFLKNHIEIYQKLIGE